MVESTLSFFRFAWYSANLFFVASLDMAARLNPWPLDSRRGVIALLDRLMI